MKKHILYSLIISAILFSLTNCVSTGLNNVVSSTSFEYNPSSVTQRSSSSDRNEKGNGDSRELKPGQTLVIGDLKGSGRINHIWFTAYGTERGFPRSAIIRIYWDNSDKAAVEVPLGDFFAVGHGLQVDVNSSMIATSSFGRAYNSYWKMPFRKAAKITVTNESETEKMGLFWYIDWEKRKIPASTPYFHAQYRQENPPQSGSDYLIANIKGKGFYVGTVLSVRSSNPGWFGEGDDKFFVDNDTVPTLHGTGTEDYFNDAWAFRAVNRPNYGITVWEGMNIGSRITAYRWHTTDPVYFKKSLKFYIEHKGNLFYNDYSLTDAYSDRRPDFYSSVAYWYQTGESIVPSTLPNVKDRMAPYQLIQENEITVDSVNRNISIDEFVDYSNKKGLSYIPKHENDSILLTFNVSETNNYLVFLRVWPRADAGTYDFYLDGRKCLNNKDLFTEHHFATDIKLGYLNNLKAGNHTIKAIFKSVSNIGTSGGLFIDGIVLEPMGYLESKKQN